MTTSRLILLALLVGALAIPVAAQGAARTHADTCHPPGHIGHVLVYQLTEHRIGCPMASSLLRHYLAHGTVHGYDCAKIHLGTHDVRLTCSRRDVGSFVAGWRTH